MISVKESYLWTQVKAGLDDGKTHLSRVENDAGTGVFDVNACRRGVEVWIELKVMRGNYLHFRTSQRSWAAKRIACGGRALVLARQDVDSTSHVWLFRASDIIECPHQVEKDGKGFRINLYDLPTPIFGCKKPFDWFELRRKIFEPEGFISVNPQ